MSVHQPVFQFGSVVHRLVPHINGEFRGLIDMGGRTVDRVDLADLGLGPVVVVDRVSGIAV